MQHSDSGIGESSPEPGVLSRHIEKDGIIPDSQSLPGSSSYIPSRSATLEDTFAQPTRLELEARLSVLPSDNTSLKDSSSRPGLPNESPAALEDSIEDSLILEVAATQSSPLYRRLRSEPPPSSTESWSSPSGSRCPSLLRSKSDFAASYHDRAQYHESSAARQSRRAQDRRQGLDKSSSIPRVLSVQDSSPRVARHTSSGIQVSHLTIPVSQPCSKVEEVTSRHTSVFQTQVPFVPASQASRTSTESAGTFKRASEEPPSLYLLS